MKCTLCPKEFHLQCADDEPYKIDGQPVCRECYFRELGNMMEKYPPGVHPQYRKTQ